MREGNKIDFKKASITGSDGWGIEGACALVRKDLEVRRSSEKTLALSCCSLSGSCGVVVE